MVVTTPLMTTAGADVRPTRSTAAVVAAVLAVGGGACGAPESGPVSAANDRPALPAQDDPHATVSPSPDDEQPLRIASVDGLDLYLPADGALLVAFHEGSSGAAELAPEIPTRAVHNSSSSSEVTTHDGPLDAMVLPSRKRAASASSAVDVVLPPSLMVLAPVTGEVVEVREYALYGEQPDVRIEIAPDDHPSLRVVLLHVEGPQVAAGYRVEAGLTPLAANARELDVDSQVDRFTVRSWREAPRPHVHIEVLPVAGS